MGCLHSKTAHLLHSPDHPSSLPDTHKPDPANGDQTAAASPRCRRSKSTASTSSGRPRTGSAPIALFPKAAKKLRMLFTEGSLMSIALSLLNASRSSLGPTPSSSWLRLLEWGS